MSGHSKWSTIKRQKGKADIKRGQTFTKLSNAITIAVKQGRGVTDPTQNYKLRLAMDQARAANMPKENIERAISRAKGKEGESLAEVIYEGFGPGGASLIIEATTDNPQRTTSEVKLIFNKSGSSFGQPGAVSYMFKSQGIVVVKKRGGESNNIFNIAIDAGAEDIEEAEDAVAVYTGISNLSSIKDKFTQQGLEIEEEDIIRKPLTFVDLDEEQNNKLEILVESLESLQDVQKVYTNAKFS